MSFYFSIVWGGSESGQAIIEIICTKDDVALQSSGTQYLFAFPDVQSVEPCPPGGCDIP